MYQTCHMRGTRDARFRRCNGVTNGSNAMLYIVRGKTSCKEQHLRVEADSEAEAEALGWKAGMFVTSVTPAGPCGLSATSWLAPAIKKFWDTTTPASLKC